MMRALIGSLAPSRAVRKDRRWSMNGKALVKLTAIATSLVLVAGFVCYRAGAFDRFVGRSDRPSSMGGTKSQQIGTLQPIDYHASSESGSGSGTAQSSSEV